MSKKILVTGSSSGIGLAIAIKLKKKGNLVIINGRNKKKLINIQKKEKFFFISTVYNYKISFFF